MDFRDTSFRDDRVELDGNAYGGCRFQRCELVFSATAPVSLENCRFDQCTWTFEGPAALTIDFMTGLYHGMGEGGRKLIDDTIEAIMRGGRTD